MDLLTTRYEQKPVANVLREIDRILSVWKRPFLEFADDNSFVDRAYWRELLSGLEGRGLRWFAETDLSGAGDGDLLDRMREQPQHVRGFVARVFARAQTKKVEELLETLAALGQVRQDGKRYASV